MDQLRLAFSNLVRSARFGTQYQDELAWHCVDSLRKAIQGPFLTVPQESPEASSRNQHRDRLCLTLISLIPAVPFRVLEPLTELLTSLILEAREGEKETSEIYLEEIKREIMERVGDGEKQFCLDWWSGLATSSSRIA